MQRAEKDNCSGLLRFKSFSFGMISKIKRVGFK